MIVCRIYSKLIIFFNYLSLDHPSEPCRPKYWLNQFTDLILSISWSLMWTHFMGTFCIELPNWLDHFSMILLLFSVPVTSFPHPSYSLLLPPSLVSLVLPLFPSFQISQIRGLSPILLGVANCILNEEAVQQMLEPLPVWYRVGAAHLGFTTGG